VRLPGIGKKTAERLVVEMRDRLDKLEIAGSTPVQNRANSIGAGATPVSDAVGALVALGYKPIDASRMVRSVESEGLASEEIIRAALKSVAMS